MTIRLADCDGHRNRANMLLSRMYSWRGYGNTIRLPADPNCITFTATDRDDVIGTLTLGIDSPAGLAIDQTFKDEVDTFRRAPGAKLCELTKFAFDTSSPARPRLAALFHLIFIYGSMHYGCTDLLIEINPRHRRFYEVMLGFRRVGEVRTNTAVNAPSQLMWINVADIRRYIDKYTAEGVTDGRSLYPHFFSQREEQGIYNRLAGLAEEGRSPEAILSMSLRDRVRMLRALGQEIGASMSRLLGRPLPQPTAIAGPTPAL
ncbi:N-acetyltransferase [Sphingomonas rhizophila]|uniref:N-acetyltransferase n=1 Tax=Sphingomonas rhizophila TaxID=2071607 RepID=A0A7G9SC30_9SPHN|nr:N-acetyltransferase [Sphingomonas rhizophila]QNN65405.1 N-acetyltransferase [Sphingomonas rhizophila]